MSVEPEDKKENVKEDLKDNHNTLNLQDVVFSRITNAAGKPSFMCSKCKKDFYRKGTVLNHFEKSHRSTKTAENNIENKDKNQNHKKIMGMMMGLASSKSAIDLASTSTQHN